MMRFHGSEETTVQELPNESSGVEELRAGVIHVRARALGPLPPPEYPDIPRDQRSRVSVGVRLEIDRAGRVVALSPSLVAITTPHPRLAEFQAAVGRAVAAWRFVPAEERHMEKVIAEDGSEFWRASRVEQVPASVDVSFTFSASGEVLSN